MPTVLIADDEASLRLLVHATLASDRLAVLEGVDGDDAWALLQEHHPVVAVLDVQMPGRSGLDLCRQIRADPAVAGTYLILLSARAQEQDRLAGLAAGADAYLPEAMVRPAVAR